MLDPSTIQTGEFEVDGAIIRVNRSRFGTVTVHQISPRFRRIGYLSPTTGQQGGARLLSTLAAIAAGARPVVRCDRCNAPLTDEISRTRRLGPECAGKLAATGRAS